MGVERREEGREGMERGREGPHQLGGPMQGPKNTLRRLWLFISL